MTKKTEKKDQKEDKKEKVEKKDEKEEKEEEKVVRTAEIRQGPEIPDFQGYTNQSEFVKIPINPHLFSGNNLKIEANTNLLSILTNLQIHSSNMDVFKGVKKVLLSSLEHAIVLTKSNSIITVKCSGNYKTKGEFNCHSKNEPHKLKKDEKVLDFSQGKKDGEFLMVTSIGKSTAFFILSATKGHSSRTLEDKDKERRRQGDYRS